jgi:hypothetical protein
VDPFSSAAVVMKKAPTYRNARRLLVFETRPNVYPGDRSCGESGGKSCKCGSKGPLFPSGSARHGVA